MRMFHPLEKEAAGRRKKSKKKKRKLTYEQSAVTENLSGLEGTNSRLVLRNVTLHQEQQRHSVTW